MLESAGAVLFVIVYAAFLLGLIAVGGYVLGYTFRKGWERAGRPKP